MRKFFTKLSRTYNDSFSYLPSKDILVQILKAEGEEVTLDDAVFISKEHMLQKILEPDTAKQASAQNSAQKEHLDDLND